jgi:aryl-alcohol dehydrogenase-like predicted oxidoreductase
MELLKQQGKIRYWGLSLNTFSPQAEANYLMDNNFGDGFQLVFNVINQRAITIIEKAAAKGNGIIARMPLQFGLLTGKFSSQTNFAKDDHRSFRLTPEIIQKTNSLLEEKLGPIGKEENLNLTQLALSYILSFPEISTIIPGIRTAEQVHQNTYQLKNISAENKDNLQTLSNEWEPIVKLMQQQG